MRILNLFIKNLNSLAGDWFIDFENSTLQAESLFLITGPTGSGKSTLLDAISLALYGRTPRLSNKNKNAPSVHEIISRHTNEAAAEVLFATRQGRFRAVWSQKKSKKKNTPGSAEHKLYSDDGQELTRGSTETLKLVEEYTGFTYQEFTRAILLAQGSFAAFLSAPAAEKSNLLEKLVNSEIYRNLSTKVYRLNESAEKAKDQILEKRAQYVCPGQEEEAAHKAKIIAMDEELAGLAATIASLQQKLQWLKDLDMARAETAKIETEKTALENARAQFAPQAEKLALFRKLEPCERVFERLTSVESDWNACDAKLSALIEEIALLADSVASRGAAKNAAENTATQLAEMISKVRPVWDKARLLDHNIHNLEQELDKASEHLSQEKDTLKKLEAQLKMERQKKEENTARLAETEAWLTDHAQDEQIAEIRNTLKEKFSGLAKLNRQRKDLAKEEKKALDDLEKHEKAGAEQQKKLENATTSEEKARTILDEELKKQQGILAGETVADLREQLNKILDDITRAKLSENFSEQRAQLVDGEPCPLCGSVHHPWFQNFVPPNLQDLEQDKEALQKRMQNAEEIAQSITNAKNAVLLAEKEHAAASEMAASQSQMGNILKQRMEDIQTRLKNADLEKVALETECRAALEPFDFNDINDFTRADALLEKRQAAWQEKKERKENLRAESQQLEINLARLEENRRNTGANVAAATSRHDALDTELRNRKNERYELFEDKNVDSEEQKLTARHGEAVTAFETAASLLNEAEKALAAAQGSQKELQVCLADFSGQKNKLELELREKLASCGISREEFLNGRLSPDESARLEKLKNELDKQETALLARAQLAAENLARIEKLHLTEENDVELASQLKDSGAKRENLFNERAVLLSTLQSWENNRAKVAELDIQLANQEKECRKWGRLNNIIGQASGDKFVRFVQNHTLELLVGHANRQLARINPRYELSRSGDDSLGLVVTDLFQANEKRPVGTLSGGETFLVSLSLALGLSALSASKAEIGSLFLDEGFGSLDNETLETAMNAIYSLRDSGRLIGIISHVEQMKQRIPVQLEVRPGSGGRSELRGCACSRGKPRVLGNAD